MLLGRYNLEQIYTALIENKVALEVLQCLRGYTDEWLTLGFGIADVHIRAHHSKVGKQ